MEMKIKPSSFNYLCANSAKTLRKTFRFVETHKNGIASATAILATIDNLGHRIKHEHEEKEHLKTMVKMQTALRKNEAKYHAIKDKKQELHEKPSNSEHAASLHAEVVEENIDESGTKRRQRVRRNKRSECERQINTVLMHQNKLLDEMQFPTTDECDTVTGKTEMLLQKLGVQPESVPEITPIPSGRKLMVVPSWEELCAEAKRHVGDNCNLDELFTEEELKENSAYIKRMADEFNSLHRLDEYDISIAALAALVGAAVDILLVGIPQKTPDGLKAGPLSNYIRDYFDKKFPEEEMKKLANSKESKVPFDAQDNRHTTIYVEGLSAYYHRLLQLGHDPLLGFVFGVADILGGRMTTIDKKGNIVVQVMENYADRTEKDIFSALAKEVAHLKSDITTSMGLPAPLMSLFNLLQFGSIGEEEQTIAEIVQGMYYEGYDFIHFCSMSVSAMLVEVIIRLGYAVKRIKEGHAIKDSIPISLNHEKHPKLATMLFIGHTGATAANAGKIYFTKNPTAINYPEWIAFGKYSYSQLKWALIEKPSLRDAYVSGKINEEWDTVLAEVDKTFDDFSKDYEVVFH